MTELLHALSSEGAIEIQEGQAELPEFVLPPSFRLLILRQLGTLPAETIEVLRIASILGASFSLAEPLHGPRYAEPPPWSTSSRRPFGPGCWARPASA